MGHAGARPPALAARAGALATPGPELEAELTGATPGRGLKWRRHLDWAYIITATRKRNRSRHAQPGYGSHRSLTGQPRHSWTLSLRCPRTSLTLDVGGDADRRGMPWKATDAMKERTKFVLEWERRWNEAEGGLVNM